MIYVTYERTSRISKFICTLPIKVAYYSIQFNFYFRNFGQNYRCDILWRVTNSSYCILINLSILQNSYNMALILNFTFKGLHKLHIAKLIEAG